MRLAATWCRFRRTWRAAALPQGCPTPKRLRCLCRRPGRMGVLASRRWDTWVVRRLLRLRVTRLEFRRRPCGSRHLGRARIPILLGQSEHRTRQRFGGAVGSDGTVLLMVATLCRPWTMYWRGSHPPRPMTATHCWGRFQPDQGSTARQFRLAPQHRPALRFLRRNPQHQTRERITTTNPARRRPA